MGPGTDNYTRTHISVPTVTHVHNSCLHIFLGMESSEKCFEKYESYKIDQSTEGRNPVTQQEAETAPARGGQVAKAGENRLEVRGQARGVSCR